MLSLDQLYAQAVGASAALLTHSAVWEASAGCVLDVEPPCDELGPPNPASHALSAGLLSTAVGPELIRRWAMKSPARAVEKARCYAGDVSRMVDVCRCRVLFASAGEELLSSSRRAGSSVS